MIKNSDGYTFLLNEVMLITTSLTRFVLLGMEKKKKNFFIWNLPLRPPFPQVSVTVFISVLSAFLPSFSDTNTLWTCMLLSMLTCECEWYTPSKIYCSSWKSLYPCDGQETSLIKALNNSVLNFEQLKFCKYIKYENSWSA